MIGDRCKWDYDPEIGRFRLPGCMGAAVYGDRGCTCPKPERSSDELGERMDRIEAAIDELRRALPPQGAGNGG